MTNASPSRIASTLITLGRALAHRNYRLFFFGQGLSLVGTWMQQVALTWLMYRMTRSPLLLGMLAFSGQIAACAASPLAGVLADRWNRHRTVLATQSLSMLQAALTTLLVVSGTITVWQIIALTVVMGLINALDMPARQSLVVDMIEDRADLVNAIALNSVMFHGARLAGPALAGIVIALFGEWPCFLLNAISYVAVLAALAAMHLPPREISAAPTHLLADLSDGVAYALRSTPIRTMLATIGMIGLASAPLGVLMPVFADTVLGGGPQIYGSLIAASGLGALTGGVFLASWKDVLGLGKLMLLMIGMFGVATIGVASSRVLGVTLALLTVVGFTVMVAVAASNTILQTVVEEDKRGRVISLYSTAFLATAPLGSLLGGGLAYLIGTPLTVALSGLLCIAGAAAFASVLPALRTSIQPIYQKTGILPELSSAIESAAELSAPPEECV